MKNKRLWASLVILVLGLAGLLYQLRGNLPFFASTDKNETNPSAEVAVRKGLANFDVTTILVNKTKVNKNNAQFFDKIKKDEALTEDTSNPVITTELAKIGYSLLTISEDATAQEVVDRVNHTYQAANPQEKNKTVAEVNAKVPMAFTPNDPWYTNWQPQLRQMGSASAWDITRDTSSVTIAIIDSGVNPVADLTDNLLPGWNFYNNNNDVTDTSDHGTPSASVAAARGNNSVGVAGWSWNAKILPLKNTDPSGYATYSSIAAAITYAADHGARIVNVNFDQLSGDAGVLSAAHYAKSKGVAVVAPAGNAGINHGYQASSDLIVVGAIDGNDTTYSWSNWGNEIDLTAAGTDYTALNNGGYGGFSGTCASSAHIAGALGLIFATNSSQYSLDAAGVDKAVQVLENTAKDLGSTGWDQHYGWGRIDAGAAVNIANGGSTGGGTSDTQAPTAPTNLIASATSGTSVSLSWTTSTDNVGVTGYQIFRDGTQVNTVSGTTLTYSDNGLNPSTSYSYYVKAFDAANNISAASNTVKVTTQNGLAWSVTPSVTTKTSSTATIGGTTTMSTTWTIEYWTGKGTHLIVTDATAAAAHSVQITGLKARTKYNFIVTATDTDQHVITYRSSFSTNR